MTTIPATLALRQALVTHLKANAALALMVGARIYDHVPERETFPYVSIRDEVREWDTGSDRGKEHRLEINCWSRAEGRRESELVLHLVETAMRDAALSLTGGHRLVNLQFEMGAVIREDGGQTYFGYARFRAVTEET